tara:strand:- start:98 stop:424 length:327 start_codon:yes stop_codon:yes gene_type:complete
MPELTIGYISPTYEDGTGDARDEVYAEYWIQLPNGEMRRAGVSRPDEISEAEKYRQRLIFQAKQLGVEDYRPITLVRLVKRSFDIGPWGEVDPDSTEPPVFNMRGELE